ncbi:hypothetical protein [Shewanella sp. GXUN23E]|uniref:hypothetical protein n=1 Tax=Shewanella sp. GXUN23E TaxID=3422498 RepID=UPI003D7E84A1
MTIPTDSGSQQQAQPGIAGQFRHAHAEHGAEASKPSGQQTTDQHDISSVPLVAGVITPVWSDSFFSCLPGYPQIAGNDPGY